MITKIQAQELYDKMRIENSDMLHVYASLLNISKSKTPKKLFEEAYKNLLKDGDTVGATIMYSCLDDQFLKLFLKK